jgi:hypothetical protein
MANGFKCLESWTYLKSIPKLTTTLKELGLQATGTAKQATGAAQKQVSRES